MTNKDEKFEKQAQMLKKNLILRKKQLADREKLKEELKNKKNNSENN